MSLNLGVMHAAVALDDSDYNRKLAALEGKSESTFKKIAQLAAGYLTLRALTGFAGKAIQTYSDLEEETNKFNVVFRGLGETTDRVLSDMRKNFGLSELAAKKMLAGTGDILTGFGFDRSTALALSEGAAKLGADIASFSNYSGGAAGATEALTKAMLGETESAKMLGVVIRQDDDHYKSLIKQAMTTGVTIDALGKTFVVSSEQQAKAVAALAMAYEQSPNAIGDFVRSQDSIANQTRILQNNLEQLFITIGKDGSGAFQDALQLSNSLVKAYMELNPATRSLLNSTAALTAGLLLLSNTGALAKANLAFTAVLKGVAAGYRAVTATTTAAAGAQALFSTATHGATTALAAFNAMLGPIGWAIIALSAAYLAFQYLSDRHHNAINGQVDAAKKNAEATQEMIAAHAEERTQATSLIERLQELSRYERLNNSEREEARKGIQKLTELYGNLGISMDQTTGKILISAGAWDKLNEAQYKQAKQDLLLKQNSAQTLYQAYGKRLMTFDVDPELAAFYDTVGLRSDKENIEELKIIQGKFIAEKLDEKAADVAGLIEQYSLYIEAARQLKELERLYSQGKSITTTDEKAKAQSKAQRKALESVKTLEWEIKFDDADAEEQARMLNEKMQEILDRQSGKYGSIEAFRNANRNSMTEQELEDLEEIIRLEEQRKQIREESAKAFEEEKKRNEEAFEAERKRNEEFFKNREKQKADEAIERQIEEANRAGDSETAKRIIQQQLDRARESAASLKQQYDQALREAEEDSVMTEKEKKNLDNLRREMERVYEEEDRWTKRAERENATERDTQKTVGAWSAEVLSAMLGPTSYEQEIAKNSRRSVDLQRTIVRNTDPKNSKKMETYEK